MKIKRVAIGAIFLTLLGVPVAFGAKTEKSKTQSLKQQILAAHQKSNEKLFRKLIHPKCPVDDAKIRSNLMIPWTSRYQVRDKKVEESFDLTKINFHVKPEAVLEYQVWTKTVQGPEIELIKAFPIARYRGKWKILEYPCFEPRK